VKESADLAVKGSRSYVFHGVECDGVSVNGDSLKVGAGQSVINVIPKVQGSCSERAAFSLNDEAALPGCDSFLLGRSIPVVMLGHGGSRAARVVISLPVPLSGNSYPGLGGGSRESWGLCRGLGGCNLRSLLSSGVKRDRGRRGRSGGRVPERGNFLRKGLDIFNE